MTTMEEVGRSSVADQRTPHAGPTRKGQGDRDDRAAYGRGRRW
jgi:hypothetical protein